jgi:hypothetical protein
MRNGLKFTESTFDVPLIGHGKNRQSIRGTLNFINFRNVRCANNSIGCTSFEGFHSTNIIRSPRIISAFRPRAIISLINLSQSEATANFIAAAAVASHRAGQVARGEQKRFRINELGDDRRRHIFFFSLVQQIFFPVSSVDELFSQHCWKEKPIFPASRTTETHQREIQAIK